MASSTGEADKSWAGVLNSMFKLWLRHCIHELQVEPELKSTPFVEGPDVPKVLRSANLLYYAKGIP